MIKQSNTVHELQPLHHGRILIASTGLQHSALDGRRGAPMKMMEGACARACANRSRTRAGPTPTNISMKSLPLMERKGTLASPAVALASSVLPAIRQLTRQQLLITQCGKQCGKHRPQAKHNARLCQAYMHASSGHACTQRLNTPQLAAQAGRTHP